MDIFILSLIIAVILALIGVLGDFFVKVASNNTGFSGYKWLILGAVIYSLTSIGWFFVMRHVKLSTLGVYYAISTVIFLTMVSVFYFKESLNHYEIIGIVLAIVSLILLAKFA
ncbi:hypothetical protein J4218_05180 [Candidatus Pacearchaeota archaeon]|nr:hypothetical protein [Candidatus Pacearchaeota archaeon]